MADSGRVDRRDLIAGAVFLVTALILIAVVTSGFDDDDDDSTMTVPTGAVGTVPAVLPNPTPVPTDVPPEPFPVVPFVSDDFARSDTTDGLGESSGGQGWIDALGTWGITDGSAGVVASSESPGVRNVAVVDDAHVNQGAITVVLDEVPFGAGVVFRYRNVTNYFYLTTDPTAANLYVYKIVAGEVSGLTTIPRMPVVGPVTVTVQLRASWIDIYINGAPAGAVRDDDLALAGGIGLYSAGPADNTAPFASFSAGLTETAALNQGVITAPVSSTP